MRVLFVECAGGFGGSLISLCELVRNLPRGIEHLVAAPENIVGHISSTLGVDHVSFQYPAHLWNEKGPGWFFELCLPSGGTVRAIAKIAKRFKADIIHANNMLLTNCSAGVAGQLRRVPVLSHQRDFEYEGFPNRLVACSRLFHTHVAISGAVAEQLRKVGVRPERCHVVRDPVEHRPPTTPSVRERPETIVITNASMLLPWKGQDVFLKAVARVIHRFDTVDIRVQLVGSEPFGATSYETHLRMLSESLAISQYVHFMGHRSDMFDILSGTDIAVHSAVQPEPFGRVVAEAMLAGVAVVATRAGGVPEFVAHGLTGLLVEPGNVDEMATAIERLIVDKELRQEIARRAAESSPDAFDPRRSAQRITELYDSILRDTSKRKSVGPIAKANERSKGLAP